MRPNASHSRPRLSPTSTGRATHLFWLSVACATRTETAPLGRKRTSERTHLGADTLHAHVLHLVRSIQTESASVPKEEI